MARSGEERLLDQLWTVWGASYPFNVCTTAASDSYRDLGKGWESLLQSYHFLMGLADPRVEKWPLMSSPFPTIGLVLSYLYFVKVGPKLMASRKPFELRPLILIYNAAVAGLNLVKQNTTT